KTLDEHAEAIKRLKRHAWSATLEIGKHLTEAKGMCGHGNWAQWLETNFGWTDRTAQNFMQVYEAFKSENNSDLHLSSTSLYRLARRSTPSDVRHDVMDRAKRGEPVSYKEVKALVSGARDESCQTSSEPKKASRPIAGELREENVA